MPVGHSAALVSELLLQGLVNCLISYLEQDMRFMITMWPEKVVHVVLMKLHSC